MTHSTEAPHERYERLIANTQALLNDGLSVGRSVQVYVDEWLDLVGQRRAYPPSRAAHDLGVQPRTLGKVLYRLRKQSAATEPRTTTKPATNTPASAKSSETNQAADPTTTKSESQPGEWKDSLRESGVQYRYSSNGKEIERRDKGSGAMLDSITPDQKP